MKRYLSIWLPNWSIERIYRKASEKEACDKSASADKKEPFAIITSAQGGLKIVAANKVAQHMGISAGQSLSSARALYPSIKVFNYDLEGDKKDLNRLALWCVRYSPWVRSELRDGILMDITGCSHLFGGEEALCSELEVRLRHMGFEIKIGLAGTLGAAWAVSRYGTKNKNIIKNNNRIGDALFSLPMAALRIDGAVSDRLAKVGLQTVGTLLNKPRAPLAARYGKQLVDRLDQAL